MFGVCVCVCVGVCVHYLCMNVPISFRDPLSFGARGLTKLCFKAQSVRERFPSGCLQQLKIKRVLSVVMIVCELDS